MKKANQVIGKEKFTCAHSGLLRKREKTNKCESGPFCLSPEEYETERKEFKEYRYFFLKKYKEKSQRIVPNLNFILVHSFFYKNQ